MEDAERAEDFNSQNGKLSISAFDRGASGDVRITLSDGSSFFAPESFVYDEKLSIGTTLDPTECRRLQLGAEVARAYRKALDLLAGRDHSAFLLRRKLMLRRFSGEAIDEALVRCRESGALDDERFAVHWVQSRIRRHPEGRVRLLAGLMKNGVHRTLADKVINRTVTSDVEQELAKQAAQKLLRKKSLKREKLLASLAARGFSYGMIRAVLETIDPDTNDLDTSELDTTGEH